MLVAFYRRTRPSRGGLGADRAARAGGAAGRAMDWRIWWTGAAGCMLIYGVLFGTGKLLLHETGPGLALLAMGVAGMAVIYLGSFRRGWSAVVD